jgi:SPX domain protein involved in polyphosphate accumulation
MWLNTKTSPFLRNSYVSADAVPIELWERKLRMLTKVAEIPGAGDYICGVARMKFVSMLPFWLLELRGGS